MQSGRGKRRPVGGAVVAVTVIPLRLTAGIEGYVVVFRIDARINRP